MTSRPTPLGNLQALSAYDFCQCLPKASDDALMNIGFGVLTEINMRDAFKSKLDMEYKNYKILGACNPKLAHPSTSR